MEKSTKIADIIRESGKTTIDKVYDILISKFPELYEYKVEYYKEAKPEKVESWVIHQIKAEIGSTLLRWYKKNKIQREEDKDGTIFYYFENSDVFIESLNEEECFECDEEFELYGETKNIGYGLVYSLQSAWCKPLFKHGKSTPEFFEKRLYNLSKDQKYGSYNLQLRSYVVTNSVTTAFQIESAFHKYISECRLNKGNKFDENKNIKIDTELFYCEKFDLDEIFQKWIKVNYLDEPLKKGFIISTHFQSN